MPSDLYSIGAVSKLVGLPQSVLRYWETVFEDLDPVKTPGGTRKYRQQDVDIVIRIKTLLYDKRYTISGARAELKSTPGSEASEISGDLQKYVINELEDIISLLNSK